MAKHFIGVVPREHVLYAVSQGIAQTGHGKRAGLSRMKKGDWLIYYSPRVAMNSAEKLQAFTAIGQIADDEIYQVEMSPDFKPYRRKVNFKEAKEVPILTLIGKLDFIMDKAHWGYMFRLGLFEIPEKDFNTISNLMLAK
ncbi:MAG: EVE domain-containing protein [Dehalococcoidia bacterium]